MVAQKYARGRVLHQKFSYYNSFYVHYYDEDATVAITQSQYGGIYSWRSLNGSLRFQLRWLIDIYLSILPKLGFGIVISRGGF